MHTYTEEAILCCITVAEQKLKTWLVAGAGHPKNAFTKGGGRWIRLLVDGNGPLALGNYLLLSNFWVLFCMLIFISWLCSKKWENRKKMQKYRSLQKASSSSTSSRVWCLACNFHIHHSMITETGFLSEPWEAFSSSPSKFMIIIMVIMIIFMIIMIIIIMFQTWNFLLFPSAVVGWPRGFVPLSNWEQKEYTNSTSWF